MGKVALITGITGQDGSYLTELLVEKGYTVSHLDWSLLLVVDLPSMRSTTRVLRVIDVEYVKREPTFLYSGVSTNEFISSFMLLFHQLTTNYTNAGSWHHPSIIVV
jgi:GDPmannose 4,6-dehydratase